MEEKSFTGHKVAEKEKANWRQFYMVVVVGKLAPTAIVYNLANSRLIEEEE